VLFCGPIYEEINGELISLDPQEALSRDLRITDTTFRDGQQSRPPYTVQQIQDLFRFLSRLSGPNGVVRQTEFFLYSHKDREAVQKCQELGLRYPEITGWIRSDEGDLSLVKRMGLKETGILTSCSDYHIFLKLRSNRRKILDQSLRVVTQAIENGIRPRCHLEDITRADIDGFVLPFLQRLSELSEQVSDDLKVKVRLCDTMGFGVSYPGASLPRSVPKLVYRAVHEGGIPSDRLEWHGHNDFHRVHINAVTTWLYGCNVVNATLLGFGERTGNPPLEAAIFEYIALRGDTRGVDTTVITEVADYFRREIGDVVPKSYPFVGDDFNVTRAGIHADGLSRDERVYNIFDTNTLLRRPPRVAITDKSGVDGVVLWVNTFLGLEGKDRVGKKDVVKIARWVVDQYDVHHRMTSIGDSELEALVKEHLPEHYARRLEAAR
jgi:isopropylmalate/homocitrate/citramalate synthase